MEQNFPTLKRNRPSAPRELPTMPTMNGVAVPAWDATPQSNGQFLQATLFGAIAALLGCVLYAVFAIVTGWHFGIVAVLVGYMVGWAVMHGSGETGGQSYQILAVVLTYFAVSIASIPELIVSWSARGIPLTPDRITLLAEYALAAPFLDLRYSARYGVISLVIIFYGVRRAWYMTRERSLAK